MGFLDRLPWFRPFLTCDFLRRHGSRVTWVEYYALVLYVNYIVLLSQIYLDYYQSAQSSPSLPKIGFGATVASA